MKKIRMKIKKENLQLITGISGLLLGLGMLLIFKQITGILVITLSIGILLWRFK